jgi:hypothetical protein
MIFPPQLAAQDFAKNVYPVTVLPSGAPIRYRILIRLGPNFGPHQPVHGSKEQNTGTNQRESIIRVSVRIPVAVGRDKGCDDEKEVEE